MNAKCSSIQKNITWLFGLNWSIVLYLLNWGFAAKGSFLHWKYIAFIVYFVCARIYLGTLCLLFHIILKIIPQSIIPNRKFGACDDKWVFWAFCMKSAPPNSVLNVFSLLAHYFRRWWICLQWGLTRGSRVYFWRCLSDPCFLPLCPFSNCDIQNLHCWQWTNM